MSTRAPTVWEDSGTGNARLEDGPRLDTPAWVSWLDDPTTTSFSFPVFNPQRGYIAGFMTVRKERRRRGGPYWTAYWRVGGRLRKAYLGASPTVTTARLRAQGAAWLTQCPAPAGP
jgi:hypothetical protein